MGISALYVCIVCNLIELEIDQYVSHYISPDDSCLERITITSSTITGCSCLHTHKHNNFYYSDYIFCHHNLSNFSTICYTMYSPFTGI